MSNQTSVDFLLKEFSAIFEKVNFTAMQGLLMKDAVEKAREIHEGQIMQAYNDGKFSIINIEKNKSLEQYYNETYKKEDK
jgi:geranylgeranyl pyrophosphate synthase